MENPKSLLELFVTNKANSPVAIRLDDREAYLRADIEYLAINECDWPLIRSVEALCIFLYYTAISREIMSALPEMIESVPSDIISELDQYLKDHKTGIKIWLKQEKGFADEYIIEGSFKKQISVSQGIGAEVAVKIAASGSTFEGALRGYLKYVDKQ